MIKLSINIRNATLSDAQQIAFVQVNAWKTTYRGMMSDDFLDSLDVQTKTVLWERALPENSNNVFVAEIEGVIVGFAMGGKSRDKNDYDSELYAINILQEYQQKNIGRLLFTAVAKYLQTCGYSSMYLWVLEDNSAKLFYERLGGKQFGKKELTVGEQQLMELGYGWKELIEFTEKAIKTL